MEYRERIYGSYVHARHESLAPDTADGFRPRAPYLRKLIRDHFPEDKNARIVELGSGHGALLYFAREAGYRNIVGIDRSPEQVAAAARLGISVEHGDLMAYLRDLPNVSVEVVVAFDVIEHLTKTEVMAFTEEVARVLGRRGRFIVHTCNGDSPFAGAIFFGDLTHETCFSRESITQLMKSSGFASVGCFEDAPIAHGVKSATRWLIWKAIRGALRLWTAAETGRTDGIFTRNFLAVAIKH